MADKSHAITKTRKRKTIQKDDILSTVQVHHTHTHTHTRARAQCLS
jgi:histone H3/H4